MDESGVEIEDLPHLHKWFKRIEARPAVQRGLNIPEPNPMSKMLSEAEAQVMLVM
jgi:glutathione S-transferase